MTAVALLAQTLLAELAQGGLPLTDRMEDLVRTIGDTQRQVRSVARTLMPVEATPGGLMAALEELAAQSEARHNFRCDFTCDQPVYLVDPGNAKHLFRIAQEAVIKITVTDDGSGLKELPPGHAGIGLIAMRQRAALLGGDFSARPRDGGDTIVTCSTRMAAHASPIPAYAPP